jgi:hypothetical protein
MNSSSLRCQYCQYSLLPASKYCTRCGCSSSMRLASLAHHNVQPQKNTPQKRLVPAAEPAIPTIHPALRSGVRAAAAASGVLTRLWSGIKLGLGLGVAAALFFGASMIFSEKPNSLTDPIHVVVFCLVTGLLIGVTTKLLKR